MGQKQPLCAGVDPKRGVKTYAGIHFADGTKGVLDTRDHVVTAFVCDEIGGSFHCALVTDAIAKRKRLATGGSMAWAAAAWAVWL